MDPIKPGDVFGRLTVLERLAASIHGDSRYLCRCECGKQREVRGSSLTRGLTKSCGCLRRELMRNLWRNNQQPTAEAQGSGHLDYAE
jgi:hypothetical protein